MTDDVFEFRDVSFGYEGKPLILDGVNLSIAVGEFVCIRGASGAGKSSLLRWMNRLTDVVSGVLYFHGNPVDSYEVMELRQRVVYVQQTPVMIEGTVLENILLPYSFHSCVQRESPSASEVEEKLRYFLLDGITSDSVAQTLSVGEQQRIALIRALFLNPDVYLLDEPTSALDEESRNRVEVCIAKLNRERASTMVMVSHTSYTPRSDRYRSYIMRNGNLVMEQ